MLSDRYYRLWADVDLDAIRSNILKIQEQLRKDVRTCAVVKADAYGHGSIDVAQAIDDIVDFYAVATIDEAMELRNGAGIEKPILILGHVAPNMFELAVRNNIRLTVYDFETAQQISQAAKSCDEKARIHIKIDTGMGRIGLRPGKDTVEIISRIHSLPFMEVEGMFTHFANADDEGSDRTMKQFELFRSLAEELEKRHVHIPLKHCSNSAAATCFAEGNMDMVRLGISMYGLYPSEYVHQIELEPSLALKSHVIMVKRVEAGTCVGYGSTWTADKSSVIATIPVGYADGYFRSLSNKGYVLIRGEKYPIVGRVCMDQLMVDATEYPDIKEGDEVVLIGRSGDKCISTEEIAELAGSFNYEFVCGLSRRVPRKYYRNGQYVGIKDCFQTFYD